MIRGPEDRLHPKDVVHILVRDLLVLVLSHHHVLDHALHPGITVEGVAAVASEHTAPRDVASTEAEEEEEEVRLEGDRHHLIPD